MKKYLTPFNLLIVFIVFLIFIEYFPFGIKNKKISDINFIIPRMSIIEKKTSDKIVLKSFRDSSILKRDIKKALKNYNIINENNKTYYYDLKQNITIKKYEVKKGFLINTIIIKYE